MDRSINQFFLIDYITFNTATSYKSHNLDATILPRKNS